jgi:proteasome lid subunit RPN8/RPN11
VLRITATAQLAMLGHSYDGLPDEACGLLVGRAGAAMAERFEPTANMAQSARVYTVDPKDHLRIDRQAEADGLEVIGVVHSHTHSEPYPSPTDVEQAPDPGWHYVIVSLRDDAPMIRSYRIADGEISEEPVVVVDH